MDTYTLAALIIGLSALASVFNARVLKLPETIGLMATGIIASVLFLLLSLVFPATFVPLCDKVASFDFSSFVLTYALGFLIFAGAFSADAESMQKDRWPIIVFATVGIILSTFIVGALSYGITSMLGLGTPFVHCLLFGALISPTDPIAVLAILKSTTVPRSLQADIAGESLLNDGVAVVVFLTILQIAGGGDAEHGGSGETSVGSVIVLLLREVAGGVVLGLVAGWLGTMLIKLTRTSAIDILVSLAVVMGANAIAWKLGVSGPLAMVATGLFLGRALVPGEVSEMERMHLDSFWEAIDHILNAVLFTLMGIVLLALSHNFQWVFVFAALLAIPAVLLSRLISVALPLPFTKLRCGQPGSTIVLLTWSGLRGGISIALALSLDKEVSADLILHMTFAVVAFSILVQGLTITPLVRKLMIDRQRDAEPTS